MADPRVEFFEEGAVTDKISVEISFQIIGLFSEGLYSSPNKAIEELVSNSFDADATVVHTVLSPDRADPSASIAVIDNGIGMDDDGLKVHWIVGDSLKARNRETKSGRRTIGKFGIGKLAAYVLGERLTHVTKSDGRFYSTSMDFSAIPRPSSIEQRRSGRATDSENVELELRELSEEEARHALSRWMTDDCGRDGLVLFGPNAQESWTAAIITDLKPMAADLTLGRLRWVLSTAMPLRDDFELYLNSKKVSSSKEKGEKVGTWRLGHDIAELPSPAPSELEPGEDESRPVEGDRRWHIVDPLLGPVSGYIDIYKDPIDQGKSSEVVGRSNGFFVYVHERLINPIDSGFGIDRNKLRHGTFSRVRVVVNMDRLDAELRSSRESLLDSPVVIRAQELLQGMFNFARARLNEHEASVIRERRASERFADSPASISERPLLRMIADAYEERIAPRHIYQIDREQFEDLDSLIAEINSRIDSSSGLVSGIEYSDLGTSMPMSVLDAASGSLSINLEHPFIAYFADEFGDDKKNLPLELFALAEVMLEAELNDSGLEVAFIGSILDSRDELIRSLAKSSGARSSLVVAQALENSASSSKELEAAVVDAFSQLGFEAIPKAGKDEADGLAEAFLGVQNGRMSTYRVSLEAKSKETPGGKVKKKAVEVSTVARHRDEDGCEYAIVVGPDFETGPDNLGAVVREIQADRLNNVGKSITLMRIRDLARLVKLAPTKRLGLDQIRLLFEAQTPDEASDWVDRIESIEIAQGPMKDIVETIWDMQKEEEHDAIDYGALKSALKYGPKEVSMSIGELKNECSALSRMAPKLFVARDDRVELNTSPEVVLKTIHAYIDEVPEDEQA